MRKYEAYYQEIRKLRSLGFTYAEINQRLGITIPSSSLTYICKGVVLDQDQQLRIKAIAKAQSRLNQQKAVTKNRQLLARKIATYQKTHNYITDLVSTKQAKFLALAMLYLGEGAKWQRRRGPMLASSDPNIIKLYVYLLKECYRIDSSKLRCRIQHRADQNSDMLIVYWSNLIGIEARQFYRSYVDKRTKGVPTLKTDYHGVCSVFCAGTYIQLELEQIAGMIFKTIGGYGAVG